ncbi:hypothetical protein SNE40_021279 [Patella caerulea]|uniref:Reverse transcriptase domain-containing protein n=1 Tax=Patella caerulea TaxID=87958 RepID=A0AAN8GCE8_PATCE
MDSPFSLDSLNDVPRLINKKSFISKLDDKSGYDHVFVNEISKQYFGFSWKGQFYVCNTLPFGWKNSAYIYHSLNLSVASYLRSLSICNLIYIDDRLIGEAVEYPTNDSLLKSTVALYATCQIVIRLGYCIGLSKSKLQPSTSLVYLGFIIDTEKQAFILPQKKRDKFVSLRENILSSSNCTLVDLQKFLGICISFMLAVPGAKLFTTACSVAISSCFKSGRNVCKLQGELVEEIEFWRFLDFWEGFLPWKEEKHTVLNIFTDSSQFKWACNFKSGSVTKHFGDYWADEEIGLPIILKEAKAVLFSLKSLDTLCSDSRLTVNSDSESFIFAWNKQGSRSAALNSILKDIFDFIRDYRVHLTFQYVQSKLNTADGYSRVFSKEDVMLSEIAWFRVQHSRQTPHTVDLMALDSNALVACHFTPFVTPKTSGVDMFSQNISRDEVCYIFPPFCMIPSVLKFFEQQNLIGSMILPVFSPKPFWSPKLIDLCSSIFLLGVRGDKFILKYPSKKGFLRDKKGLPQDFVICHVGPKCLKSFTYNYDHSVTIFGDSIVRGLDELVLDKFKVLSYSGIRISGLAGKLLNVLVSHGKPIYLFVHVGINDFRRFKSLFNCKREVDNLLWLY